MRSTADGRDTRNARGRATARAIEREAVRLSLKHGAAAVTVADICEGVGITERSFFNHFAAKEDAVLGWEIPRLDEDRVRLYLADPDAGVLTGAMGLVSLPRELLDDRELAAARFRVLASTPELAHRQAARIRPLADRVEGVVLHKLRLLAGPEVGEATLEAAAGLVTAMAAALAIRPLAPLRPLPAPDEAEHQSIVAMPDPAAAASAIENLRWIWPRML